MKKQQTHISSCGGFVVYTNNDLMEMFEVSAKTISRWRNDGILGFSHIGDRYFYTENDISKMINNSHVSAFA